MGWSSCIQPPLALSDVTLDVLFHFGFPFDTPRAGLATLGIAATLPEAPQNDKRARPKLVAGNPLVALGLKES